MKIPSSMPHLKGFRFAREIIVYAVWADHRFALSTADVEDLLAERGVFVSRETVRLWMNRFARISQAVSAGIDHDQMTNGILTRSSFRLAVSGSGTPWTLMVMRLMFWCKRAEMPKRRDVSCRN